MEESNNNVTLTKVGLSPTIQSHSSCGFWIRFRPALSNTRAPCDLNHMYINYYLLIPSQFKPCLFFFVTKYNSHSVIIMNHFQSGNVCLLPISQERNILNFLVH